MHIMDDPRPDFKPVIVVIRDDGRSSDHLSMVLEAAIEFS
jgi:hypothetical protein